MVRTLWNGRRSESSRGVVYHIWKIHFNSIVTTPDQLGNHAPLAEPDGSTSQPTPPAARGRRDFWRPAPAASAGTWLRVFRHAMACRFEALVPAGEPGQVDAARAALGEAERLERAWSVFRDDSELSRLNRDASGGPCDVDAELFALLARCRQWTEVTGGAFDITATPLSRCWRWLERQAGPPSAQALAGARALVGPDRVILTPAPAADQPDAVGPGGTVRFARPGVELNLGAIGKGYAVGRIAAALRRSGVTQALVSAGDSSIEAVGAPAGGWDIALRGQAAGLRLRAGAVATSGASEQGIDVGGVRLGHVLDPRTGRPSRGVTRVTVVAPDAADADALATALLVGGPPLAEHCLACGAELLAVFTLEAAERPRIMGRASGATVEGLS